jgi:DnaJ-class molecular chaperone
MMENIKEIGQIEGALSLFGFASSDVLSRAVILRRYRELVMINHPDMGGDADMFNRITEAYAILKRAGYKDNADNIEKTIDGYKLCDLGNGYPITESAITCETCDGHGYRQYSGMVEHTGHYEACKVCGGDGLKFYPCKKCEGTGKYRHPKSGKVVGECYQCNGTGKFYPFGKIKKSGFGYFFDTMMNDAPYVPGTRKIGVNCPDCNGRGRVEVVADGRPFFRRCDECKGVGEIRIFNPVLPRGLFAKENTWKG